MKIAHLNTHQYITKSCQLKNEQINKHHYIDSKNNDVRHSKCDNNKKKTIKKYKNEWKKKPAKKCFNRVELRCFLKVNVVIKRKNRIDRTKSSTTEGFPD
jgi:hypothetical protein